MLAMVCAFELSPPFLQVQFMSGSSHNRLDCSIGTVAILPDIVSIELHGHWLKV